MAYRGNTIWHTESQRYLGPQVREIRRTLQVEIKPLEEGVVSPFVFQYEDAPQECTSSLELTDGSSLHSSPTTAPSDSHAITTIRQAKRVDLLGICRTVFQWIIRMLSMFISGSIYLAPLLPLLMLLLPTSTTSGNQQCIWAHHDILAS
jgi:hypothetical protein